MAKCYDCGSVDPWHIRYEWWGSGDVEGFSRFFILKDQRKAGNFLIKLTVSCVKIVQRNETSEVYTAEFFHSMVTKQLPTFEGGPISPASGKIHPSKRATLYDTFDVMPSWHPQMSHLGSMAHPVSQHLYIES
ncbi:hypothetical protein EGW08_021974, partial [Elysia chlorotica]